MSMRLVLVNHCHPATPHVCALRMREFARALAGLGHAVVLLTETLDAGPEAPAPETIKDEIAAWDFAKPFFLACPPTVGLLTGRLRAGTLPPVLRQGVIAWHYLARGGVFSDWRAGTQPYLGVLAEAFRPDLAWASFGNTDCWNIGRDLARLAGCPWVADFKDFWGHFIPAGLRRPLARRYTDAAAMTAFSETHLMDAEKWFAMEKRVIRSGVRGETIATPPGKPADGFTLSLTGSIYDRNQLARLIAGIAAWLASLDEAERGAVRFHYAGDDREQVAAAARRLESLCAVEIAGFIPLAELQRLHRASRINLYMKSWHTFHHKLIELLVAGRPVLAFPGENEEARRIARETGGVLHVCGSESEIVDALEGCRATGDAAGPDREKLAAYGWEAQAVRLSQLFERVAAGAAP